MEAAARIVGEMFSLTPLNICRGKVSCPGPETNMATTTSSRETANAKSAPVAIPGKISGIVTRISTRTRARPEARRGARQLRIEPAKGGPDVYDDERQREHDVRQDETEKGSSEPDRGEEEVDRDGDDHHRHGHREDDQH